MPSTEPTSSEQQNIRWKLVFLLGAFALLRPIVRMTGLAGADGQLSSGIWAVGSTVLITAVWILVVVLVRPARPFLTLILGALAYAVLSSLMSAVFSPILTGEFQGPLANPLAIPVLLLTNALWGAAAGIIALGILRLKR